MSHVVRLYVNGDSFHNLLAELEQIPPWVREFQVVLAFARDYDGDDNNTNGFFSTHWSGREVTPACIAQLKVIDHRIKVLVSIGERDGRYRFEIPPGQRQPWITHAFDSLRTIIEFNGLDGIDVYYQRINGEGGRNGDFVDAIGQLITRLKSTGVAHLVSIASSAPVNANFYYPLYSSCDDFIDNVVYQCYNESPPITKIREFSVLYRTIANNFYPSRKLLAGYSNDSVSVINSIFLPCPPIVKGFSIWTVSDLVHHFRPQLIIKIIDFVHGLPGENLNPQG